MKELYKKVKKTVKFYTDKRFSTIAGTLVYFLLMSVAPFIVWLTLLLGNSSSEAFLSHEVFSGIAPFLNYLKSSAQSAASSSGIILLVTSLYSSTNFFYHLRRSGEIIYGSRRVKGGIRLRIISAILIILTILSIAVFAAVGVAGGKVLSYIMPVIICDIISAVFVSVFAFLTALLMNLFACPYKLKISEALPGSLLTTVLWLLFVVGFAVYLNFASPGKLYGAIASVIVFLLWCYFLMCCLVIGMVKNGSYLIKKQYKQLF